MSKNAAMTKRSVQRARRGGLQFDLMIVFMVLFWASQTLRPFQSPNGCEKESLCDAVFFPEHDSQQRHATDSNHRPRGRLGDGRDGNSVGELDSRDEVRVHQGSGGGVVFANRVDSAAGFGSPREEEVVARHRESAGIAQPRDETGVDNGSGGGVVFTNGVG